MGFDPLVTGAGLVGWKSLKRSMSAQLEVFEGNSKNTRDIAYYRRNSQLISSASDITNDRSLLSFALRSFGLGKDINSKFFVGKMLVEGTKAPSALANKLTDKRYKDFVGHFENKLSLGINFSKNAQESIVESFVFEEFAQAVGEQNNSFRLALNFEKKMGELARESLSEDGLWYRVLGTPPIRKVLETSLGVPSSVRKLGLERQLEIFKDKALTILGSKKVSVFRSADTVSETVERFILKDQINSQSNAFSSGVTALTLLQSASAFHRV